MLESPDYAKNWARYWRDVFQFHASNTNPAQVRFRVLEDWLNEQLAKNAPWDEVATALITATGPNDTSGPANFLMAHMGQPVELAGEVSRVFMGVQIQCAQCHDHPTDPWTRKQFHEFAAFFAGLRQPPGQPAGQGQLRVFEVAAQRVPRYTMPDLKDPQKQIPIAARFFLASRSRRSKRPDLRPRRALAASFVTGQDNPWFAKAFVNRLWYALIGTGFYNPVDDIGPNRSATAPEVLEALAAQWQEGGYDVRWLFRTILNTKTYQREVRSLGRPNQALVRLGLPAPAPLTSSSMRSAMLSTCRWTARPGNGHASRRRASGPIRPPRCTVGPVQPRTPVQLHFRRRSLDPERGRPRDDSAGPLPDEQPAAQPGDQRFREATILGRILADNADDHDALEALYYRARPRAQRQGGRCLRRLPRQGRQPHRRVRGHPLEPGQLHRIRQSSLSLRQRPAPPKGS